MKRRRARLTQQELKQLGVRPGLLATRYPAGKDRVQVRRLTTEPPSRAPFCPWHQTNVRQTIVWL